MKNQPLYRRAGFALEGLMAAWKSEKSVRAHGMAIAATVLLLFYLQPEPVWWALTLLAVGTMLVVELINTSVEKLTDRLHPDLHPDIKIVKDVLAGAVFVSCCAAGCVVLAMLFR